MDTPPPLSDVSSIQPSSSESGSGSSNEETFNCTEYLNMTAMDIGILSTPTNHAVYITLAMLHILFSIFPATVLALLANGLITQLTPHPSKVVLHWICVFCIVGPGTYALAMDISLFVDIPALGRCDREWEGAIYWLAHSQFETSLLWIFALNAVVMYISVRRKTTHFNKKLVHLVTAVIVLVAFLQSIIWVMITEKYVVHRCKIRGSFCIAIFGGDPLVIVLLEWARILIAVTPVLVCVPLSLALYWRKVKKSISKINKNLAHSLTHLSIALLAGTFLCNLPTMLTHFATYRGQQRTFVSLATTYALQLNYILYPLLILILHRDLREAICNQLRKVYCCCLLFKKSTQVADEHEMPNVIISM